MDQAGFASSMSEQTHLLRDIRDHAEYQSKLMALIYLELIRPDDVPPQFTAADMPTMPSVRSEERVGTGMIQWNDPQPGRGRRKK